MYTELHASSAFSFLEGASLPEALVEQAHALGYNALALLDRDGVYGAPRFYRAAIQLGLRPIFGAELTVRAGRPGGAGKAGKSMAIAHATHLTHPPPDQPYLPHPPDLPCLPLLIETGRGYRNLCRLITKMKLRAPKGEGAITLDDLDDAVSGLVALPGRELLLAGDPEDANAVLDRLIGMFGREQVFVDIQRHLLRDQEADNRQLRDLAAAHRVRIVATNGVRFAKAAERPLFDVLTCTRHKTDLDHAGRLLAGNSERRLKSPKQMEYLFRDLPDAIAASHELGERLQFTLKELGYRFPRYPVPEGETLISYLRLLTDRGARDRYRPYHDKARRMIEHELAVIEKLDLAGYFLIVWDIVEFCRREGILVQGRGSAANSAVCYSLGITAVDAVKYGMLFERFLSEERGEWPDIDLDLPSGDRRERVIQHVYQKYGRHGAAMTANVITYRSRSAAREVGKSLGLDDTQIDRLARLMNNFEFTEPGDPLPRRFAEIGWSPDLPKLRHFARLWHQIQDLPRHLGQHSGGMVICQDLLDEVVPIENASMPDRTVIQWDKDDCADMGIVKVDLLGLGMMAVLEEATELINRQPEAESLRSPFDKLMAIPSTVEGSRPRDNGVNATTSASRNTNGNNSDTPRPRVYARGRGTPNDSVTAPGGGAPGEVKFDLAHLPENDPEVYELLRSADTIGVFQVESRAQMATLPRLAPKEFYDLVVEVAIIRPGPIVGQMVHPYLNRRAGREPIEYPHPSLEPILKRTMGVPLFQEQLLRVAMVAAGFNGGQAEELRRAMGFKRSEQRMKKIEVQLREGMARNGITGKAAEQIILSITSFALYGFPESHAISFALLAYASAYLKVHFPAVFYTALLNNQPMGFYHPSTLVKEAQRRGVHFAPIDVEASDWNCTLETEASKAGGAGRAGKSMASPHLTHLSSDLPYQAHPPCLPHKNQEVVRLGLRYADGVRADAGKAIAARARDPETGRRFHSLDDLVLHTGIRRDELRTLATIGALNCFGYHRRSALWQAERSIRPSGDLFQPPPSPLRSFGETSTPAMPAPPALPAPECPLTPMTLTERLHADYEGTGLTLGRHPMALRRDALNKRRVLRACDLRQVPHGQWVRTAGSVITRQRPGTAKGFVFLTLEDETGLINVIIRPQLFTSRWLTIIEQPFLYIEGVQQNVDGVINIRAEQIAPLGEMPAFDIDSHDFH